MTLPVDEWRKTIPEDPDLDNAILRALAEYGEMTPQHLSIVLPNCRFQSANIYLRCLFLEHQLLVYAVGEKWAISTNGRLHLKEVSTK